MLGLSRILVTLDILKGNSGKIQGISEKQKGTFGKRGQVGEWPSGLRRYNQNRQIPGSYPTRHSAGHGDLVTRLTVTFVLNAVINIGLVRLLPSPKLVIGQPSSRLCLLNTPPANENENTNGNIGQKWFKLNTSNITVWGSVS